MNRENEKHDLEPWNEESDLEPWSSVEKFHLTAQQTKKILKHTPQESDGFLRSIERFIERHKSAQDHPASDFDSAYKKLDGIAKDAKKLKSKLQNLDRVSRTFIRQHSALLEIENPDLRKLEGDLEVLYQVADSGEPEPGKRGPRGKQSELRLCQQLAKAWKHYFSNWPGKTDCGPFHLALDLILPLANYETIGEDIVKKAVDAAIKEEIDLESG